MRVFKTRVFDRFAAKSGIADAALLKAIAEISAGLVHADLGGGVLKQRVARAGGGKSGGFRTIILFRVGELAFFVEGFAKNDRDNITRQELAAFRLLAGEMLAFDERALTVAISASVLVEIDQDDEALHEPGDGLNS